MLKDLNVQLLLSAVDRMSPVVQAAAGKVHAALGALKGLNTDPGLIKVASAAGFAGGKLANVVQDLKSLALTGGVAGFGLGALAKSILDTNRRFENLEATLTTVSASSEEAKRSLDWASDFAAKTPYDLEQVTRALVELKTYGIDAISGDRLRKIGDAASGLHVPLEQAIGAVTATMRGENDPIRRWGINAVTKGDKVTYSWKQAGETITRTVAAADAAARGDVAMEAMGANFAGSMERLSKTLDGILSNIGDQWDRFQLKIGRSGFFQFVKQQLQELMAELDRLAADGTLERWAKEISDALVGLGQALKSIGGWVVDVKDYFGSWTPILGAVAGAIAGPLIASLASLGVALFALSATMLATPAGWMLIAIAAVAAAGVALYLKWDRVKEGLLKIWGALGQAAEVVFAPVIDIAKGLGSVADWIGERWSALLSTIGGIFAAIRDKAVALGQSLPSWLGGEGRVPPNALPFGELQKRRAEQVPSAFPNGKASLGEGRVVLELPNAPAGTRVKDMIDAPGFGLSVDMGLSYGRTGR